MSDSDNVRVETWGEYQRLVLADLARLSVQIERQQSQISRMEAQIAVLKLQAGAWGFVAGAIVAIGTLLLGKF